MAETLLQRDPMAKTLPSDIITLEILPRLPATSLIRLKRVCKFFNTIISSSEFINLHLRVSLSSDSNRLLIVAGENLNGLCAVDLGSPASDPVYLPLPRSVDSLNPTISVLGCCNGLLCIQISSYYDYRISLLNPSTGIYRQVLFHKPGSVHLSNFGFGFDHKADDYKIVTFVQHYVEQSRIHQNDFVVYSLKANTWRMVEKTSSPYRMTYGSGFGALINNHLLHWKFGNYSDGKHRIRCFDLQTEQWGNDVPLPQLDDEVVDLGIFDGCLSVLTMNRWGYEADVWIMKEYGVKESWVKLSWKHSTIPPTVLSCHARENMAKWGPSAKGYICRGSLVAIAGGRSIRELDQLESNQDEEEEVSSSLRENPLE